MLYLLALSFLAGAVSNALWITFHEWRRYSRYKAWESIREGATGTRVRLSEVLRRQGVYDQPEMRG